MCGTDWQSKAGGGCPALSRRGFLAGCAVCAAGVGGLTALSRKSPAAEEGAEVEAKAEAKAEPRAKARVRLVFTHIPSTGPIWPNIGYDFDRRKKELIEGLTQGCPNVEFLPVTAQNSGEAQKILEAEDEVDGYLVYMVGLWTGAPQAVGAGGRPTVFVDDLYAGSGEFLIANAAARRAGHKVVGVSSSRLQDVVEVARCFGVLKQPGKSADDFLAAADAARKKNITPPGGLACIADEVRAIDVAECLKRLGESKILVVGRDPGGYGKAIEEVFGTKVIPVQFEEMDAEYEKADRDQAAEFADRWIRKADVMLEPTRRDVEDSGAMYLAMQKIMSQNGANAIAINCLGGFYNKHLKAYPCLGFCQLNDDGLVGACEADLRSTITMLVMGHLVGRPGFISDPVIDTYKYQIIYAHCVAPTKVFGPEGPANPCHIRTHSEDRQGAALRSMMPLGYMTSTLEFEATRKQAVFHQGKSTENIDDDKACRTKLAVTVQGDIDKLMNEWDQWGWHRVTFYGDLKEQVQEISKALGLSMIEEA